ncbi:uncharacterized protein LOC114535700 [Dendronephthya gigantea]|uniref:uncharacterized protein LOC114535700 n=1 Tax=Dendronephthya gigantea TaxID=151771 RepID=UPI00106968E3|nr:uncharacterized protein LOC114535700 [Dendronephthya gigantea]
MKTHFLSPLLAFFLSIYEIQNVNMLPTSFNTNTSIRANSSGIHNTTQVKELAPVKKCNVSYVKMGCYADPNIANSSFPSLILKPVLPLLKEGKTWSVRGEDWNKFLQDFVCSCAQKVKELKYNYFGVKSFDQCWSGDTTLYYRNPISNGCLEQDMKSCSPESLSPCAGNRTSVFVYSL